RDLVRQKLETPFAYISYIVTDDYRPRYITLLIVGMQLLQNWRRLPGADFIAAFNPVIWVIFSTLAGITYPLWNSMFLVRELGWLLLCIRWVAISLVAGLICLAIYGYLNPKEPFETLLRANLYFFVIPSVVISGVCCALCGFFKSQ